jgi:methionyl-tRNA formyltransferase
MRNAYCDKIEIMKNPRVVFMGSPNFSLPSLRSLAANYNVVGVVTQPDRPAGRGRKLTPPPVKELALELGLTVYQPQSLREDSAMHQLEAWKPDIIIVSAFGMFLTNEVLELPPYGCLNIHPSLLPRWRGAGPVQAAILNGDARTGVTIMVLDEGMDTGPLLSNREAAINADDTHETLTARLAEISGPLLLETLPAYLDGSLAPQVQDESLATFAPKLEKAEGELDVEKPAEELILRVRACSPWPGAFTYHDDKLLKVWKVRVQPDQNARPGRRAVVDGLPALGVSDGWLVLETVQLAGKKAMPGDVFLRGVHHWEGEN